MRVTIVGIGGVGSHLADDVARLLLYLPGEHTLTLVDKDTFEERNRERQAVGKGGNKAKDVAEALSRTYTGLRIDAVPEYLSPETAEWIMLEDEVILLCVDNHQTRKVVSDFAATRKNISVLSVGNEVTWGNMFVYVRRDGRDVTPSFTAEHPEIADPKDKAPWEMNCEEQAAAGAPQLFPTNIMGAAVMLAAFYRLVMDPTGFASKVVGDAFPMETAYTEVHFDIEWLRVMPRRAATSEAGVTVLPPQTDRKEIADGDDKVS